MKDDLDYELKNLHGYGEEYRSTFAGIYDAQSKAGEGQRFTPLFRLLTTVRKDMFGILKQYEKMNAKWNELVELQQKELNSLKDKCL